MRLSLYRRWRGLALTAAAWAALVAALAPPGLAAQGQAHADLRVGFAGVLAITDVLASSGPANGMITLRWTAPAYTGGAAPLSYQIRVSTTGNIADPTAFAAGRPLSDLSTATIPSPSPAGTTESLIVVGLSTGVVHYFAVRGVDSGAPQATGYWQRDPTRAFNVNNFAEPFFIQPLLPMQPLGVQIQYSVSAATLSWLSVQAFENGAPFADPANPRDFELSGYQVYRSTAPSLAPWTELTTTSTSTWSYADLLSGPQYYYHVKAFSINGRSAASMIRAQSDGAGIFVADDNRTMLRIPDAAATELAGQAGQPQTSYTISASSHSEDIAGRVVKSVEFSAKRGGSIRDPDKRLSAMALLRMRYEVSAGQVVPSGMSAAAEGAPSSLSVFWHNGSKWVQLFGRLDEQTQSVLVQTPYLGRYQLRTTERPTSFNFDPAGLSNRMVTPNGDGKNDTVVFAFANPKASSVAGRIYDSKGRLVAAMAPGPVADSLQWDGRSNSVAVPSGVYLYQIEAEGRVISGTIVVVR